ncbi:MAG TPA: inositol monophosphatase family protein [Pyrinomonadaceae bacterium]|jgi:histidinol phosphatase-like enzyme (inositol monophosphatase family)
MDGRSNGSDAAKRVGVGETELREILDFAVEIARGAGEITLKYFRRAVATDRKADGSFVTAADREAERFLRAEIERRFADDAIVGEEEDEREGSSGRRWIIDPIDGTYSFIHGVPFYGVLVGLEICDEPSVGVVNIPALDEMVSAARGLGARWNGETARVSGVEALDEALLLSTDFGMCERYGFGAASRELERRAGARRTWGDCYGHLLVATGRAEIMLDPVMNVWDCAALLPIVEEAGGTFTDWRGQRTIRGGNAVSTNGALLPQTLQIIDANRL